MLQRGQCAIHPGTLRSLQFITPAALLAEVLFSHLDTLSSRLTPLMSSGFKFLPAKTDFVYSPSTSIFSLKPSYAQVFVHVWISFSLSVRFNSAKCTCYICRTVWFFKFSRSSSCLGRRLLIRPRAASRLIKTRFVP